MLKRHTDALVDATVERHHVIARQESPNITTSVHRSNLASIPLRDRLLRSFNFFKSTKLQSRNDARLAGNFQCDAKRKNFCSLFSLPCSPRLAFTLSEILITLGIIGIVAALVIPAVIQNSQDAEYKTGKDKVRMSVAEAGRILSVTDEIASATSTEDFVRNYLSKQLKIIKYCAPADMEQCGMPSGNPTSFKNLYNANVASMPKSWTTITDAYGVTGDAPADGYAPDSTSNPTTQNYNNSYVFLTANGIAVNLFYNPYCVSTRAEKPYYIGSTETYTQKRQLSFDTACMSGVYDMNGLKKPNQVGRDIGFFGVFYNGVESTSVATLPYKEGIDTASYNWTAADNYCNNIKGYKLPTVDELGALYLGRNITGMPASLWMWTNSTIPGSSYSWAVSFYNGYHGWGGHSDPYTVRCVRD